MELFTVPKRRWMSLQRWNRVRFSRFTWFSSFQPIKWLLKWHSQTKSVEAKFNDLRNSPKNRQRITFIHKWYVKGKESIHRFSSLPWKKGQVIQLRREKDYLLFYPIYLPRERKERRKRWITWISFRQERSSETNRFWTEDALTTYLIYLTKSERRNQRISLSLSLDLIHNEKE